MSWRSQRRGRCAVRTLSPRRGVIGRQPAPMVMRRELLPHPPQAQRRLSLGWTLLLIWTAPQGRVWRGRHQRLRCQIGRGGTGWATPGVAVASSFAPHVFPVLWRRPSSAILYCLHREWKQENNRDRPGNFQSGHRLVATDTRLWDELYA